MDGAAQQVYRREACHRTGGVAVVLFLDRLTLIGDGTIVVGGVAVAVEVEVVVCDTRTCTIDVTAIEPLRAVEVIGSQERLVRL